MRKVTFNMTMSLDGFVAGPNDNPENGLGDGGERGCEDDDRQRDIE